MSTTSKMPATTPGTGSKPIVVSGPSGSGKSTILKRLLAKYPDRFMFSVSHTTRSPRAGEEDGKDYYFVSRQVFEHLIAQPAGQGFIEHATFGSNLYGSSYKAVENVQKSGKTCLLDIEMQGVKQLRKSHIQARYLFLQPPTFKELEARLRARGTDTEDAIQRRLKQAHVELESAKSPGLHDKIVINDDLELAYQEVEQFCLQQD